MIFLTSCSDSCENIKNSFSCPFKAEITERQTGTAFSAEFEESGCLFRFSKPDALKDVVLKGKENDFRLIYEKLDRECKLSYFRPVSAFYKAVSEFQKEDFKPECSKGICSYTVDGTEISVYYRESGNIISRITTEEDGQRFVFDIAASRKK